MSRLTVGLCAAWIVMILAGVFAVRSGVAPVVGHELTLDRTVFTIINCATLTGFAHRTSTSAFTPALQALVIALTVGGALFALIAGGALVSRILSLPYSTVRLILAAFFLVGAAILIGLVIPGSGPAATLCAFANSGLSIGAAPDIWAWQTHAVLLPLVILGGLGLPVILELLDGLRGRRQLSFHAQTVLVLTSGIYLIGMLVLAAPGGGESFRQSLLGASAAVIGSRTAGLAFDFQTLFPAAVLKWIVLPLMIIGASPGGTGGGLKTTTVAQLFLGARSTLRGEKPQRAFGIAAVWLTTYVAIVFVATALLIATQPQMPLDRLLFLTISALSNVGWSHDPVTVVGGGLYILCALMLLGRLLPLAILFYMARTTTGARLAIA